MGENEWYWIRQTEPRRYLDRTRTLSSYEVRIDTADAQESFYIRFVENERAAIKVALASMGRGVIESVHVTQADER
jgi:hypothetical protein